MSVQPNLDQTYLPLIKQHARDRWHERTPAHQPLASAWFSATPVDAPAARCSHARLYEPTDASCSSVTAGCERSSSTTAASNTAAS